LAIFGLNKAEREGITRIIERCWCLERDRDIMRRDGSSTVVMGRIREIKSENWAIGEYLRLLCTVLLFWTSMCFNFIKVPEKRLK